LNVTYIKPISSLKVELGAMRAARPDIVARVRGLKANASTLPPEELDKLDHLAATDCQTWARDEIACAREFDLTILGGCCGTDQRYIEALAQQAWEQLYANEARSNRSSRSKPNGSSRFKGSTFKVILEEVSEVPVVPVV
jgi:hypothetical protein